MFMFQNTQHLYGILWKEISKQMQVRTDYSYNTFGFDYVTTPMLATTNKIWHAIYADNRSASND